MAKKTTINSGKDKKYKTHMMSIGPEDVVYVDGMGAGVNTSVRISIRYDDGEPVALEVIRRNDGKTWVMTMEQA